MAKKGHIGTYGEELDVPTMSLNDAWVQCENPSCLKWRRISPDEVALLGPDSPWFCYMNSDVEHNHCEDTEEDYASEEKRARQLGLQYVQSCLAEGTLVWARMNGYCRWPAMVCRDPVFGVSIQRDCDGDVRQYHVEFLGVQHSRGWIHVRNVELYGFTKEKTKNKQDRPATKKRKKNGIASSAPRQATSYKRGSVDAAIEEANQLLEMLPKSRLERQCYKPELLETDAKQHEHFDPEFHKWLNHRIEQGSNNLHTKKHKDLHPGIYEFDSEPVKVPKKSSKLKPFNTWKKFLHCGKQRQKYLKSKKPIPLSKKQQMKDTDEILNQVDLQQIKMNIKEEPRETNPSGLRGKNDSQSVNKSLNIDIGNVHLNVVSQPEATLSKEDVLGCLEIVKLEPESSSDTKQPRKDNQTFQSPVQKSHIAEICSPMSDVAGKRHVLTKQLKESTSLVGRTKEEKFQLDIEMYRRNEKAFAHDVCRFMHRNKRKVKLNPVWQNVQISLFQLFLSVYERGGYHALSKKVRGGWEGVYREVTGVERGGGMVAKKFYESNLLPYELYIAGYKAAQCFQGKKQKPCKPPGCRAPPPCDVNKEVDLTVAPSDVDLSEIDQMLQELDHYNSQLDEELKKASGTDAPYLQVMFYDDSPSVDLASQNLKLADTAAEFGQHARSPEGAQEVADVARHPSLKGGSKEQRCQESMTMMMHKTDMAGGDAGKDDSERVLHEMEALQEQLDKMNYHARLSTQLNAA